MEAKHVTEDKQSRRFFLAGLITFLGSLVVVVYAALRFLVPNVQYGKLQRFKVGMPQDFPDKQATYLSEHQMFIVRDGDKFLALSATCTHLGCAVRTNSGGREFFCPCHGSRYSPDGKNESGPAPRPLDSFELSLGHHGELVVDKSVTVSEGVKFRI